MKILRKFNVIEILRKIFKRRKRQFILSNDTEETTNDVNECSIEKCYHLVEKEILDSWLNEITELAQQRLMIKRDLKFPEKNKSIDGVEEKF